MRVRAKGLIMATATYLGGVMPVNGKLGLDLVKSLRGASIEDFLACRLIKTMPRDDLLPMFEELVSIMLLERRDADVPRLLTIIYNLITGEKVLSTDEFKYYTPERRQEMRSKESLFLDYVFGWYFQTKLYKFDYGGANNDLILESLFPLTRKQILGHLLKVWSGSLCHGYVDDLSIRAFGYLKVLSNPTQFLGQATLVGGEYERIKNLQNRVRISGAFFFPGEEARQVEEGLKIHEPKDLKVYREMLLHYKKKDLLPEAWLQLFSIGYVKKGGTVDLT